MTAESGAVIQSELKCCQCGYNLNTLSPDRSCPECGLPIAHTLLKSLEEAQVIRLRPVLPMKLRLALRDGLVLVLGSVIFCIVMAYLPRRMFDLKTLQRQIVLGIACTSWTLAYYGMWKLGVSTGMSLRTNDPVSRRLLRIVAIFLLLCPVSFPFLFDYRHPWYSHSERAAVGFMVGIEVALLLMGALLMLRISRVTRAMGASIIPGLATLLACTAPACHVVMILWSFDNRRGEDMNSLAFLMGLPHGLAGPPDFLRDLMMRIGQRWDSVEFVIFAIPALVAAASAVVIMLALVVVLRAEREEFREPVAKITAPVPARSS